MRDMRLCFFFAEQKDFISFFDLFDFWKFGTETNLHVLHFNKQVKLFNCRDLDVSGLIEQQILLTVVSKSCQAIDSRFNMESIYLSRQNFSKLAYLTLYKYHFIGVT